MIVKQGLITLRKYFIPTTLASEGHPHIHCFYEWLNPINDTSGGVYPFRTGISAVRIALADILAKSGTENGFSQGIQH
jgi:hypothetical protein